MDKFWIFTSLLQNEHRVTRFVLTKACHSVMSVQPLQKWGQISNSTSDCVPTFDFFPTYMEITIKGAVLKNCLNEAEGGVMFYACQHKADGAEQPVQRIS